MSLSGGKGAAWAEVIRNNTETTDTRKAIHMDSSFVQVANRNLWLSLSYRSFTEEFVFR